ncbi:hypothetical protein SUGI_0515380 [Cryptomeria japonica]|uniref:photosystem II repair protein PSB27-H1, chloroplastic n=1 Tax=Cryptomeria japonica TaxID=3369 RepID=UPI002408B1AE|nr:photosystem II repair protein PSB27-H1, chloroplastic [Cryptomeria japonica]GLJ26580.1 hypothetical protein SUGI_0515380 [Cryptomeria japonica]
MAASSSAYLSLVRCPSPSLALPIKGQGQEKRVKYMRMEASRREVGIITVTVGACAAVLLPLPLPQSLHKVGEGEGVAVAAEEAAEYERETRQVISQVRGTIEMEKGDPNTSTAVAALREASNNWVAKYRRDKQLAGKPSFSNMYSVLNAISGHYISFGPTAPIPSKRKARILEEVDTAEKALSKGR